MIFQDDMGWTPLMIAVSLPDGDVVAEILLRSGADVSVKSEQRTLTSILPREKLLIADPDKSDFNGQVGRRRASSLVIILELNDILECVAFRRVQKQPRYGQITAGARSCTIHQGP